MLHVSIENEQKLDKKDIKIRQSKSSKKKISRKKFFQRIGLAASVPLAGVWYSTSERSKLRDNHIKEVKIPPNIENGISFFDSVIVSKSKNKIEIFSSKCTHLGCRINKFENGELVCPCHGSEFSENGRVVKGPAAKPLKKLPFKIDPKTGEITVNVMV